ncbi:hypothetical protein ACIQF8_20245 [Pseudarthrobacter sp. NPDC092184]|uniref:hypothetical protein n=1 Tax=unclassified Pseudarthrobacter TaxID=2647000 RepID=UPI0038238A78
METALVVAIIAAAASVVSAAVAALSARSSRLSANHALSVNHHVASVDRDAEELREAFKLVMDRFSTYDVASVADLKAMMGALEGLMGCRGASKELEGCGHEFQMNLAGRKFGANEVGIKQLRKAYTACQDELQAKRDSILERPSLRRLGGR